MSLPALRHRVLGLIDAAVPTQDLLEAYEAFDRGLLRESLAVARSPRAVLGVGLGERRQAVEENARGADALADMDLEQALRRIVRAIITDPQNQDARANYHLLIPLMTDPCAHAEIQRVIAPAESDSSGSLRSRGRPYAQDPFRVHVEPLELDVRKGTVFLHTLEWSTARWKAVIASYCASFTDDDDVQLVLWLDPKQGISADDASARVAAVLAEAAVDLSASPDILLVADRLDDQGIARLYAAADCVVPNGNHVQEEWALWCGASVLTELNASAWRAMCQSSPEPFATCEVRVSERAPRVSCVIPSYNYAHYLPQAIESALSQDYPADALEVIVVDDGSTDGTPEVVRPYMERVRYLRKPNGGLTSSVNFGVQHANGEFICLLDADDVWLPHKTRRQVERLLKRPEAGLVYGDMVVIDGAGQVLHPSFFGYKQVTPPRGNAFAELCVGNVIGTSALMLRASLRERVFPVAPQAAWPDWWIATLASAQAPIELLGTAVYKYRLHGENMGFDAIGPKLGGQMREELPFRRWVIDALSFGKLRIHELLRTYVVLEDKARHSAQLLGVTLAELLPVTKEDRAAADQRFADATAFAAQGNQAAALHRVVQTLARDPWHPLARQSLRSTIPSLFAAPEGD